MPRFYRPLHSPLSEFHSPAHSPLVQAGTQSHCPPPARTAQCPRSRSSPETAQTQAHKPADGRGGQRTARRHMRRCALTTERGTFTRERTFSPDRLTSTTRDLRTPHPLVSNTSKAHTARNREGARQDGRDGSHETLVAFFVTQRRRCEYASFLSTICFALHLTTTDVRGGGGDGRNRNRRRRGCARVCSGVGSESDFVATTFTSTPL
jgi:hypothetical protein